MDIGLLSEEIGKGENQLPDPLLFKGRDRPVLREVEGVGMGLLLDE